MLDGAALWFDLEPSAWAHDLNHILQLVQLLGVGDRCPESSKVGPNWRKQVTSVGIPEEILTMSPLFSLPHTHHDVISSLLAQVPVTSASMLQRLTAVGGAQMSWMVWPRTSITLLTSPLTPFFLRINSWITRAWKWEGIHNANEAEAECLLSATDSFPTTLHNHPNAAVTTFRAFALGCLLLLQPFKAQIHSKQGSSAGLFRVTVLFNLFQNYSETNHKTQMLAIQQPRVGISKLCFIYKNSPVLREKKKKKVRHLGSNSTLLEQ